MCVFLVPYCFPYLQAPSTTVSLPVPSGLQLTPPDCKISIFNKTAKHTMAPFKSRQV